MNLNSKRRRIFANLVLCNNQKQQSICCNREIFDVKFLQYLAQNIGANGFETYEKWEIIRNKTI